MTKMKWMACLLIATACGGPSAELMIDTVATDDSALLTAGESMVSEGDYEPAAVEDSADVAPGSEAVAPSAICSTDTRMPAACAFDASPIGAVTFGHVPAPRAPCNPLTETVVTPSDTASLQARINALPRRNLCFRSGRYNLARALNVNAGQTLRAESNVVLSGSVSVTGFGTGKQATLDLPTAPTFSSQVDCDHTPLVCGGRGTYSGVCGESNDVYVNGNPLKRVGLTAMPGAGEYQVARLGGNRVRITLGTAPGASNVTIASTAQAVKLTGAAAVIDGFIIEQFANPSDVGAVVVSGNDAKVMNTEVRHTHATGIQVINAARAQLVNNNLHHNGQVGAQVYLASQTEISGNTIEANNAFGYCRIDGAAGGLKVVDSAATLVSLNDVKDNLAVGVWFDRDNKGGTITRNLIRNSFSDGVRFEISSGAKIDHNVVVRNALGSPSVRGGQHHANLGAGITLHNANGGCVYRNILVDNLNGVALISRSRTFVRGGTSFLAPNLQNVGVYDNAMSLKKAPVTMAPQETGIYYAASSAVPSPYLPSTKVVFFRNSYTLESFSAAHFKWTTYVTSAQWKSAPASQDACSTFVDG